MQDQQKQLIDKLKGAQNVLVTVSRDPSVDQLAAAIGLTLALNKLDKHATAVFSGRTPSTIEFLRPEDTLEATTDSLRDFIIALDKSKADKLRYKVEDQVVRIFITPYRTSISEKDLNFSQGDFNVDVVVALGVQDQQNIDDAVQAHGRILHDAAVAVLAIEGNPELGTLNLVDASASSLSEMVAGLVEALDHNLFDGQIATALLTGIVARTNRFSNDQTTPKTMSISSVLMAAGANQQLIATELERSAHQTATVPPSGDTPDDGQQLPAPARDPGTLEIDHNKPANPEDGNTQDGQEEQGEQSDETQDPETLPEERTPRVHVNEDGQLVTDEEELPQITGLHATNIPDDESLEPGSESAPKESVVTRERIVEPPSRDSLLSANIQYEEMDLPAEQLTAPSNDLPLLSHEDLSRVEETNADAPSTVSSPSVELPPLPPVPPEQSVPGLDLPDVRPLPTSDQPAMPFPQFNPDEIDATVDTEKETLTEIEEAVHSSHVGEVPPSSGEVSVDEARNAVEAALNAAQSTAPPAPITALNAQPLGSELHMEQLEPQLQATQPAMSPMPGMPAEQGQGDWVNPAEQTLDMPLPPPPVSSFPGVMPQQQPNDDDTLPPPPPVAPPPIFPS